MRITPFCGRARSATLIMGWVTPPWPAEFSDPLARSKSHRLMPANPSGQAFDGLPAYKATIPFH